MKKYFNFLEIGIFKTFRIPAFLEREFTGVAIICILFLWKVCEFVGKSRHIPYQVVEKYE